MSFIPSADPPLVPDMDQRVRSAVRKYTRPTDPSFERELERASPQARRALREVDTDRLTRGSRSISQPASAVALRAASTGDSVVGNPEEGLWGDFTRNVSELTSGLPKLPAMLVDEIRALPSVPEQIPEAFQRGDSLVQDIGNVANLPGFRMIPGSYVVGRFGTDEGGVDELVDNPLFTALDVLPYASKAAKSTKVFKAAEAAARPGQRVGAFGSVARYGRPVGGPVVDAAGNLTPNRFGRALERGGERFAGTRTGEAFNATFGRRAGDNAQQMNRIVAEHMDPRISTQDNAALIAAREKASEVGAFESIDQARRAEIRRAAETDRLGSLSLTADEQAFVAALRDQTENVILPRNLAEGELLEVPFRRSDGSLYTEVYKPSTGRRILGVRRSRDKAASLNRTYEDLVANKPSTPAEFFTRMADSIDDPLSASERGWKIRGELHRLELGGYDVKALKKQLEKAKARKGDVEAFQGHLAHNQPAIARAAARNLPDRATLAAMARTDPLVKSYMALADAGQWSKASKVASQISKRAKFTGGIAWADVVADAKIRARVTRSATNAERYASSKVVARAEKAVEKVEARAMPARYETLAAERIQSELGTKIADLQAQGMLSADDAAKASELLALEILDAPSLPESVRGVAQQVSRDVRRQWQQFAEAGIEPVFIHRTARSAVGRPPSASSSLTKLSQVQERALNFGSTVEDWAVAVDAQAAEILSRSVTKQYHDFLVDSFAKPLDEIKAELTQFAEDAARRNPSLSPAQHMDRLVARNWRRFQTYQGEVWLPRDVARVAEGFGPKTINSALMATYDGVMKAFRTSLLPLSPRWHLYNMVGGAIMVTAEHGFGSWKHFREAWDLARSGEGLPFVEGMPAMGKATRALREQAQWARNIDLSTEVGRTRALWDSAMGKTMRRLWDESESVAKAKRGASWTLDRSYAFNEMFDDMYRTMSFLRGKEKGLAKYGSLDAAEQAGVAAARKVLASWDRLTPIERSIIRNIFPFYSWSKLLLGYVTRFPFDHPIRTSVTASLVQAELEDFGTGLPQSLFSMVDITGPASFLGMDPGEGEKVMLNLNGMNPFKDVASWASLVSFFGSAATGRIDPSADIGAVSSQSSPALQYLLGALGVDPSEGLPDPYMQTSLDPRTGQLRVVNEFNPLAAIPQSIVPQLKIANDVLGVNRDFQRLVESNPDAARRRLMSSAGLPAVLSPRTLSPEEEIIKAEVRRYEDVSRTKSRALREGNLDLLDRYPGVLGPTKRRLEEARRRGALQSPDEDTIRAALGT